MNFALIPVRLLVISFTMWLLTCCGSRKGGLARRTRRWRVRRARRRHCLNFGLKNVSSAGFKSNSIHSPLKIIIAPQDPKYRLDKNAKATTPKPIINIIDVINVGRPLAVKIQR